MEPFAESPGPKFKTRAAQLVYQMSVQTAEAYAREQEDFDRVENLLAEMYKKLLVSRGLTEAAQVETIENCKRSVALVESIF